MLKQFCLPGQIPIGHGALCNLFIVYIVHIRKVELREYEPLAQGHTTQVFIKKLTTESLAFCVKKTGKKWIRPKTCFSDYQQTTLFRKNHSVPWIITSSPKLALQQQDPDVSFRVMQGPHHLISKSSGKVLNL